MKTLNFKFVLAFILPLIVIGQSCEQEMISNDKKLQFSNVEAIFILRPDANSLSFKLIDNKSKENISDLEEDGVYLENVEGEKIAFKSFENLGDGYYKLDSLSPFASKINIYFDDDQYQGMGYSVVENKYDIDVIRNSSSTLIISVLHKGEILHDFDVNNIYVEDDYNDVNIVESGSNKIETITVFSLKNSFSNGVVYVIDSNNFGFQEYYWIYPAIYNSGAEGTSDWVDNGQDVAYNWFDYWGNGFYEVIHNEPGFQGNAQKMTFTDTTEFLWHRIKIFKNSTDHKIAFKYRSEAKFRCQVLQPRYYGSVYLLDDTIPPSPDPIYIETSKFNTSDFTNLDLRFKAIDINKDIVIDEVEFLEY